VQRHFDALDVDGSGAISMAELEAFMGAVRTFI
jgi:hypothetical protein